MCWSSARAFGLNLIDGCFTAIEAKAIILACGGYEEVWGFTDTGPDFPDIKGLRSG